VLRSEATPGRAGRIGRADPDQRRLLIVINSETGIPYQELSGILAMPTGSIGPTRARCLAKLRRTPLSGRPPAARSAPAGRVRLSPAGCHPAPTTTSGRYWAGRPERSGCASQEEAGSNDR
jgi:hypothetical protein